MGQNVVIDVPMRDIVTPRRHVSGTQKLRDSMGRIHATIDKLNESIDRFAETKARAEAIQYLTNPPPEVQAMRDRAAFDQAFADRNERQRQQIKATQDSANKFFRRDAK